MKIARVKLSGFKSFGDPVELRILPGLTGIVGPNGCGKSNLLEAIRWAMGEGSPKSLRGAGMEDVIFAGTATRPPRQFAEVSILAERDDDEIEVTRRVERGAGSAYRINGRDARARDAQLLFADAATGAHSPALVSQGKIGAVIAARPAERRTMLEEAAGIAGLHVRRREAELRLKATEANLARVAELVAELDARAGTLRRQARTADRYRKLSDDIRIAEGRLIFARWRDAAAAADLARSEATACDGRVVIAAEEQRATAASARAAAGASAAARANAQAARDRAAAARHALATAEGALRAVETRIASIAVDRDRLETDRAREGDLASDAAEALGRLAAEAERLAAQSALAQAGRAALVDAIAQHDTAARDAELALAHATAAAAERSAERRVTDAAVAVAEARDARATADHARAAAEAAALPPLDRLRADLTQATTAGDVAAAAVADAAAALDQAEAGRTEVDRRLRAAQVGQATTAAALAALDSEARSLVAPTPTSGALSCVIAAPGYETALAAALADDLAAEVGHGNAPRRWTGAAILPDDPPLAMGAPLAHYITAPPELARRLAQIAVVETDHGETLAVGQRLVTRDGQLRRWDGFVSIGSGAAEAARFVRRNRSAGIAAELPPLRAAAAATTTAVADATAQLTDAVAAIAAARRAREAADAAHRAALRQIDIATAGVERSQAERARLGDRIDRLHRDSIAAKVDLETATARRPALPADDGMALLGQCDAAARAARTALATARADLASHDAALAGDRARKLATLAEAEDWRARSGKTARRVEDLARRTADLDREAESLVGAPEAAARTVAALGTETRAAGLDVETALDAERTAEAHLRDCETDGARVAELLAAAREARAGAAARAENQNLRRVEMGRVAGERFECPPAVLPARLGFAAAAVGAAQPESARLDALTMERERLGPVNLIAGRELAELEAGRATSAVEHAELTEAMHRLRGAIGSLNREGRIKLRAAFDAVDRHFRTLFTTLFDGGEAHLALIDSDDPLDAGLEIMAQPPGKKLASLTLLSGGEQALTAVALIFALFLTNPAPLCVLDEVDAPLDDANVERFCDLLDAMTRETATRYLVVTHNAVTMARMHRLYGVTMVEAGLSRLVSVDLGRGETLIAAE